MPRANDVSAVRDNKDAIADLNGINCGCGPQPGRKEFTVSSDESSARNIAWGPSIIVAFGSMLIVLGAVRFVLSHHFGFIDRPLLLSRSCSGGIVPSCVCLRFSTRETGIGYSYFYGGILAFSFPVADVALGLALVGAIAVPALSEWRNEKRLPKAPATHGSENEERG